MASQLKIITPINHYWRREFKVAAASISAGTEGNPDISLVPDIVDLEEGDWVTIDSDGKLIKVTSSVRLCWPVWTPGGDFSGRATKKVVVIQGIHTAFTTKFNNANVAGAAIGDPLAAKSGVLDTAVSGDVVVAVLEKLPFGATTQFANGFIQYSTVNVGHVLP